MKPPSKTAPAPQHAGLRAPRCVTPTPSTWRRRVCRRLVRTERWITAQKRGTPQGGVGPLGTAWHNSRPKEGVAANRRREITPSKHAGENQRGLGVLRRHRHRHPRHGTAKRGLDPPRAAQTSPRRREDARRRRPPPRHKGMPRSPRSRCAESTSASPRAKPRGRRAEQTPKKAAEERESRDSESPSWRERSNPDPRGEEKNKGKTSKNPGDLANSWLRWHRGIRSRAGA